MIKIGYSADAFIFDFEAGTDRLRPDYDHYQHRVKLDFTDDDAKLDGDNSIEEIGDDPTQTAVVSGDTLGYSSYSDVACFGPGTLIATTQGELPVEWLTPGDRIITRDHGAQTLRAVEQFETRADNFATDPILHPVSIPCPAGAPNLPRRPLVVTRQHRILMQHSCLEYLFGVSEVLAAAGHLHPTMQCHRTDAPPRYFQLLLDQHQIIMANGLWVESLLACDAVPYQAGGQEKPLIRHTQATRPILREWECRVFLDYLGANQSSNLRAA